MSTLFGWLEKRLDRKNTRMLRVFFSVTKIYKKKTKKKTKTATVRSLTSYLINHPNKTCRDTTGKVRTNSQLVTPLMEGVPMHRTSLLDKFLLVGSLRTLGLSSLSPSFSRAMIDNREREKEREEGSMLSARFGDEERINHSHSIIGNV